MVGATSMTWLNWWRSSPRAWIRLGPAHDGGVARAAPVRGDLLGPLIRRAQRVRPADRVVRVGPRGADAVDVLAHEVDGLEVGAAVGPGHRVEGADDRAFRRGAVVADDVVDDRVVEDLELGERVDEAADVVVGELQEAA